MSVISQRRTFHIARLFVITSLLVLAITDAASTAHAQAQSATQTASPMVTSLPVLLVHGFNSGAAIPGGCNGNSMWGTTKSYLSSHGYTGQLITIGFYNGDTGCDINLKNRQDSHCSSYFSSSVGDTREDQRHIACNLAWYIWNTFSQKGQSVQIVSHSMGGTIVRWAIYAGAGSSSLPPHLYVRNSVTLATPHNGIPWGGSATSASSAELQPGSSFLSALQNNAQNPQAVGGTNWTIFGSSCESWLNGGIDTASEMSMAAQHKVLYLNPPCYHHGDYLTDNSDNLNASVNYCNNACSGQPTSATGSSTTFPRSLHEVLLAISN